MSSFIYFYSKFTEEFLLLGGAAIFTLLAAYCYHWVIKRRRLGAARSQVPSGVVKAYLNQLIQEAQFVRTQLFGLVGGDVDPSKIQNLFLKPQFEPGSTATGATPAANTGENMAAFQATSASAGSVPTDLLERLKALESQLAQKESLVVNINVEKTKLLEEIENLKQNQKALQNSNAMSAGQDELLKKIKNLEERLEEYSLFEDDLANLKRLQQENSSLKKRLEEAGANPNTVISASAPEPIVETVIPATPRAAVAPAVDSAEPANKKAALDQNTIDSLLDGVSPIAPQVEAAAPETPEPSIDPTPAPSNVAELKPKSDDFENLVDSVETSLAAKAAAAEKPAENSAEKAAEQKSAPAAQASAPATAAAPQAAAPVNAAPASVTPANAAPANTTNTAKAAAPANPISEKSDEELLKEFENLLNS